MYQPQPNSAFVCCICFYARNIAKKKLASYFSQLALLLVLMDFLFVNWKPPERVLWQTMNTQYQSLHYLVTQKTIIET